MKTKKIIIILSVAIVCVALVVVGSLINRRQNQPGSNPPVSDTPYQADFLSAAEKQALKIPTEFKVQAIKRNGQGSVMVYKIIRNDSEAVDPAKITPISPRAR